MVLGVLTKLRFHVFMSRVLAIHYAYFHNMEPGIILDGKLTETRHDLLVIFGYAPEN